VSTRGRSVGRRGARLRSSGHALVGQVGRADGTMVRHPRLINVW
jgi:hypothetical protein